MNQQNNPPASANNMQQNQSAPLSVGQYMIIFLIYLIPLVNIIMLFVWAFSNNVNINKKNYARAMLIWTLILIVLSVLFSAAIGGILAGMLGGRGNLNY